MIRLVIFKKGSASAQRMVNLNVPPQGLLLGRSRASNIIITDPKVSHNHAVILHYKDGYYIKDIGSKNGTFVNGNKVAIQKLNPGDEIRLGDTTIRFMAIGSQPVSNNNTILIPIITGIAVVIFVLIITLTSYSHKAINSPNNIARKPIDPVKATNIYNNAINNLDTAISNKTVSQPTIDKTINELEEAKKYDPTNPDILDDLSSLYILKGDVSAATNDINYVKKQDSNDGYAKVVSDLLNSISNGGK